MSELTKRLESLERYLRGHDNGADANLIREAIDKLNKAEETALFYKDHSGDKSTLKFGLSRVLEELRK